MIISKTDKAFGMFAEAMDQLNMCLATQRGTKEAREDAVTLRQQSFATRVCPYCGKPIVARADRHQEACLDCSKLIDKMLQLKSKVLSGTDESSLNFLEQLMDCYVKIVDAPYALRGSTGNMNDVVDALGVAIIAGKNYKLELKAAHGREATRYIEQAERKRILDMLVRCGADPNAEETKQRVDEIYYSSLKL